MQDYKTNKTRDLVREDSMCVEDRPAAFVEKRAYERVPVNMEARFFFGNAVYQGRVTDISEKGMFISTDLRFPTDYKLDIMIRVNNKIMQLPVKVMRSLKSDGNYYGICGMGIQLLSAPQNYLDFVRSARSFRKPF